MSHDRGCPCGREKWDYSECDREDCYHKEKPVTSTQVGGTHYAGKYQHWDWAIDVRLGYLEAAATKYLFRWYKKGGIEDLEKARSYLIKARDSFVDGLWENKCLHVDSWPLARDKAENMFSMFVDEANVPEVEADLCLSIAQWRTEVDLNYIIGHITEHIRAATAAQAGCADFAPLVVLPAVQQAKKEHTGTLKGTVVKEAAHSTSVEVVKRADPNCSGCFGRGYIINAVSTDFEECACTTDDHPAPFGYDGDG